MTALEQRTIKQSISKVFKVIRRVAEYYDLKEDDLRKETKNRKAVHARSVAASLLFWRYGLSYSDIGRLLNRNHSTIMYHIHRIMENKDREIREEFWKVGNFI